MTIPTVHTIESFIKDTEDHSCSSYVKFIQAHPTVKQRINNFFDIRNFPKPLKRLRELKKQFVVMLLMLLTFMLD